MAGLLGLGSHLIHLEGLIGRGARLVLGPHSHLILLLVNLLLRAHVLDQFQRDVLK